MRHFNLFLVIFMFAVAVSANASAGRPVGYSATDYVPADYTWTSQSHNSSESMPCGGGDIGLNVWAQQGDVVFYIARSGCFDENNTLLKLGRVRLKITPKISNLNFRQTLRLSDGSVVISDDATTLRLWVDVYKPVVHVDIESDKKVDVETVYESWRTADHVMDKREAQQCSYKWTLPKGCVTSRDSILRNGNNTVFYHANPRQTVFEYTLRQQQLDGVADSMYNPLRSLVFGGEMRYARRDKRHHSITIALARCQESVGEWKNLLASTWKQIDAKADAKKSACWWHDFWQRSYIEADGEWADAVRNYTLFRYMLGCNAMGEWPTKFNGGLFTFDPEYVDTAWNYTPDFRKWGGGTHTAQNQRLVYWPMLATGDVDMMKSQFDFYLRILPMARLRVEQYWHHEGACFVEQLENFGLCNPAEYGSKRPADMNPGVEKNKWLEYEWDTVLEFCDMILQTHDYSGLDITPYLPLVESVLTFFDEHYTNGDSLVLWPGSACETYKLALNPTSTIAGLRTVLNSWITVCSCDYGNVVGNGDRWRNMLRRLPAIPLRTVDNHLMIAPAERWERVQNVETPQLYPVFPWHVYGLGHDSLEIARNTYLYDPDAIRFRSSTGWKQDNIWAASLGLTQEAKRLTLEKLADGPYRFPAFWGPGYDWSPDHNWGGSAMLGLHAMLLQETPDSLMLLPAWDKNDHVRFRLHTRYHGVVESHN